MGCTPSIPLAEQYQIGNQKPKRRTIPISTSIPLSEDKSTELLIEPASVGYFKHRPTYTLTTYNSNEGNQKQRQPFHNLRINGKEASIVRGKLVLEDSVTGEPVAVVLERAGHGRRQGTTMKIYKFQPLFAGQKPSKNNTHKEKPLYAAFIVHRQFREPEFTITPIEKKEDQDDYNQGGGKPIGRYKETDQVFAMSFVVEMQDQSIATIQGGKYDDSFFAKMKYLCTVSPGVDPCLIVLLFAIHETKRPGPRGER